MQALPDGPRACVWTATALGYSRPESGDAAGILKLTSVSAGILLN
jgi:hypothetical protein